MSKAKAMMITLGAVGVGAAAVLVATTSRASAGQKPAAQKPAAQKPAAQKPGAQKPAAQKPPPSAPPAQKPPPSAPPAPKPSVITLPPIDARSAGVPQIIPSGVVNVPDVKIFPGEVNKLANELGLHLVTLQLSLGGVKQAKGKENKTLVAEFQKAQGLTVDGSAGPATIIGLARRGAAPLPLVMYWPKAADKNTVLAYRAAVRLVGNDAPEPIRSAILTSANKEQGQGGINGPMPPPGTEPVLSSSPSDKPKA